MIEINDYKYQISYTSEGIPVLKVSPQPDTLPKTLSKYYSLNKNNVDVFLNSQFYVSQPENLNDLFDFNFELIDFSGHSFSHVEVLFPDPDIRKEEFQVFEKDKRKYLEQVRNSLYGGWIANFGLLSLTEDKYSDLMWAHYSNHNGFLLEFNYEDFDKKIIWGPYPINYCESLNPIDFSKYDKTLGFFAVGLLKKTIWKYENEFRFFCLPDSQNGFKVTGGFSNIQMPNLQDRLISYPMKALKKIILAFRFYTNDITIKVGHYEYLLDFKEENENAHLKISLFDKIIKEGLCVELCVMQNFKIISIPVEIIHINKSTYKIKENRSE